jgi:tetratricopeptide (TPR) repeat protein
MAAERQLDAPRSPRKGRVIFFLIAGFLFGTPAIGQEASSDQTRLVAAQEAFDAGRWQDASKLALGPATQSPDFDFLAGLSLARMEKWNEANRAFAAGARKTPNDPRFFVELAGIAYQQKDFRTAKRYLHAALRRHPRDSYPQQFLATIYFLEGNLAAALKYWNPEDQPRIRSVAFAPPLQLRASLRDRALAFNAPQVLTGDALLTTRSRLSNLGIFSNQRVELTPAGSGNYDVALHLAERNGWGDSKWEGILSLFGGLPYATIYPEFHNLGRQAVNLTALARWDPEKRRVSLALSMPVQGNPGRRLRLYADARNENWNLSQTFFGAGIPPSDLNIRRVSAGAEFHAVVDGRWNWSSGVEFANRNFRNLTGQTSSAERPFFTATSSLAGWLEVRRTLVLVPERRFSLDSSAQAKAGRNFADGLGRFGTLGGSLRATWLPQAQGDDYQIHAQIRAGGTAGKTTLDELFQLGVERDNDLWLRGHAGTFGGRKGAAPLGRRYFLANWELDKNIYRNGFFTLKIGPFLDSGAVADSSEFFGSRQWLWDSGLQCKVRILSGVTVSLSYGRSLRGGKGVFYGTVLH